VSLEQRREIEDLKHRVSVLEAAVQALLKMAKDSKPTLTLKKANG
jgi:hypothetical protein